MSNGSLAPRETQAAPVRVEHISCEHTAERFRDSYHDLRRIAAGRLSKEHRRDGPSADELVHDAFLRLRSYRFERASRPQFVGVVSRVMRRILVDRARYRGRLKRGQGTFRVPAELVQLEAPRLSMEESMHLKVVLDQFRAANPRAATVIEWRAVRGMEVQEIASALGLSKRTVHRDWTLGVSWLRDAFGSESA